MTLRFMNLGIFIMLCLINSLPTHTFTTINSIISDIYGIDKVVVAINTLLFPISHPIMAFLANWILDKYGLKLGVLLLLFSAPWGQSYLVWESG